MPALGLLATCMTGGPLRGTRVQLVGRADPRGARRYNKDLGADRAQAVKSFLVDQGVDADRILTASAGERGVQNVDPQDWDEVRRVDIVLF